MGVSLECIDLCNTSLQGRQKHEIKLLSVWIAQKKTVAKTTQTASNPTGQDDMSIYIYYSIPVFPSLCAQRP